MSALHTAIADAVAPTRQRDLPVWVLAWLLAAAVLVARFGGAVAAGDFADPDNAMWLVGVRDILNGQGWWDATQYRLNPPSGTDMHWARWLGFLIAAPVALLTPLMGQPAAETVVAFAWPLGLLAVFIALVSRIAGELAAGDGLRREASIAGALVAALAFPATEKFAPGAFDHHGLELVLCLIAVLGLMRMDTHARAGGLTAGAALGLAMATAAEGVPFAAAGMVAAGVLWLLRPGVYAAGLFWSGVGIGVASLVSFGVMVPPETWGRPVCDAMSASFLGFGLAASGVAMGLARALPVAVAASLPGRFGAAAVVGGVAVGVLWVLFPACAGGGYSALDGDLQVYWLAQIAEARSLLDVARSEPATVLVLAGSAFAGLVAAVVHLVRRPQSGRGWIVLLFLVTALAILVWQVRGSFFATAFAAPFGAWAAVRARQAWQASGSPMAFAVFALVAASSIAAAWSAAGTFIKPRVVSAAAASDYVVRKGRAEDCLAPPAFAGLRTMPPSVILNSFVLGHVVLLHTEHSVTAGPYHRNAGGLMTMISAMRASPDAARALVAQSAADHVLVCAALPEMDFYRRHPADGVAPDATLAARLAAGDPPDWLAPVEMAGPLQLYRIIRPAE